MSIVTYTVRSDYPRLLCTSGDQSAITTRTNSSTSWKTFWDGTFASYITTAKAAGDSTLATGTDSYKYFWSLGLHGWIESDTASHNKLLSAAKYLANNTSLWLSYTSRRWQILALSYAYNFLRTGVVTFSAADRKTIGDALMAMMTATASTNEYLDGYSSGNMAMHLVGGITLYGESGTGYDYTANATTKINAALDFWYGATAGGNSHLEVWRYFVGTKGAHWLGVHYAQLGAWKMSQFLNAVRTGFIQNSETPSSLQLNGVDYDPVTDETFLGTFGEWLLWVWLRGDYDWWHIDDCSRQTSPWMNEYMRPGLAFLITYGGTWRKQLRWMYDILDGYETTTGTGSTGVKAQDVALFDPSAVANASQSPTSAATSKVLIANPPGQVWHRNTWEFGQGAVICIDAQERYLRGHTNLKCGAIQMSVKDDVVLCHTGRYNNSDTNAQYEGTHSNFWYKQSISHSGVPLCDDGVTTHQNYAAGGGYTTYPSGLGGQLWKKYLSGGTTYIDCYNLTDMRFQGSGEAWRRATLTTGTDTDDYLPVYIDLRPGYAKDVADMGAGTDRMTTCKVRMIIIKREGLYPIVLRVVHMVARSNSYTKRDQWHSYNNWTQTAPQANTLRCSAAGQAGTGRIIIDIYNPSDYAVTSVGGGAVDSAGYAAQQFYYGSTNYPPAVGQNSREIKDIGRYRLDIRATVLRPEQYFVEMLQPTGYSENTPSFQWIDEANWFGVRFSSTAHEYRIHKTQDQVSVVTDSTPPAAPSGVAAEAGDEQVTVTWDPNVEEDISTYKVYYRAKV